MKILYGIQTTGNGHINRSSIIIDKLKNLGYQVDILTSGDENEIRIFDIKYRFDGLKLKYKNGRVDILNTILSVKIFKLIKDVLSIKENYDLIITDFEPISSLYSILKRKKSIGISNQVTLKKSKINFLFKLFIKYFSYSKYNIGYGYKEDENNDIFLPLIDENLLNKDINDNKFYLVYLPYIDIDTTINILSKSNNRFKLYTKYTINSGYNNIEIYTISKERFQEDLLNCSGIITSAGFSTTSEALYLNKKLYVIPIKSQYEQESNSEILNNMGVVTGELSIENLEKFHLSSPIKWKWTDPTEKIIQKIIEIYERKN